VKACANREKVALLESSSYHGRNPYRIVSSLVSWYWLSLTGGLSF
jgi:hypothetical protein